MATAYRKNTRYFIVFAYDVDSIFNANHNVVCLFFVIIIFAVQETWHVKNIKNSNHSNTITVLHQLHTTSFLSSKILCICDWKVEIHRWRLIFDKDVCQADAETMILNFSFVNFSHFCEKGKRYHIFFIFTFFIMERIHRVSSAFYGWKDGLHFYIKTSSYFKSSFTKILYWVKGFWVFATENSSRTPALFTDTFSIINYIISPPQFFPPVLKRN